MSNLEARVTEVLEEHVIDLSSLVPTIAACACDGWAQDMPRGLGRYAAHREHVAAMLAPVIAEAQAEAWDEGHTAGDECGYQRNEFEHSYVDQIDIPGNPYEEQR